MNTFCKQAIFYYSFEDCAYIAKNSSRFHYAHIEHCSENLYNALLERGWRRFGEVFFVPVCDYCNECKTIRNIVLEFEFSKNHKRILNKNKHIEYFIKSPRIDGEKMDLYNKYHAFMNKKRGWRAKSINYSSYEDMFIVGQGNFAKEISYYLNGELICIAFTDILPNYKVMSANYCFYDPDFRELSLGTFSILKQFEIAKELKLKYIYPGYWIKNHESLGYKERFRPFEMLLNRPHLYEVPLWKMQKVDL